MKNMDDKQIIGQLCSEGRLEEALAKVEKMIATAPADDSLWYESGRINWRLGRRAAAITAYNHAIALNPASPAAEALAMVNSIMDFYNPDLLNP